MAGHRVRPKLLDVADVTRPVEAASESAADDATSPDLLTTGPRASPIRTTDLAAVVLLLAALVLSVLALGSEVSRRITTSTTLAPAQSALTSVVTARTDAWGRSQRSTTGAARTRPSGTDRTATAYGSTLTITAGDLDRLAARSASAPDDGPALGIVATIGAAATGLTLAAAALAWRRRRVLRIPAPAVVGATALLITSTVVAADLLHRRQVAATRATRYLILNDTADRAVSVTVSAGRFLAFSAAAGGCALLATALLFALRFGARARTPGP